MLSTTHEQNPSSRLLFSIQVSSLHYHNLEKRFYNFISACLLNSRQILWSFTVRVRANSSDRLFRWGFNTIDPHWQACNWTTKFRSQRTSHTEPSATSTTVTEPVGERLQAGTEDAPVLDHPAPLRRIHDSGAGYKYSDLLTYLLT